MKDIVFSFIDFTFTDNVISAKYYENEYLDDEFSIPANEFKAGLCIRSDGKIFTAGKLSRKIENIIFRIIGQSDSWPFGEGKEDTFRIEIESETQLEYNDIHCF